MALHISLLMRAPSSWLGKSKASYASADPSALTVNRLPHTFLRVGYNYTLK